LATNFLRSLNPFDLTDPPKWFLGEMAKFDRELVLFASLKDPVFRLTRRCMKSPGVPPANVPGVSNHPDTLFMWNHKVVPITTVVPRQHWGEQIFKSLRARDTWAAGGANKVISLIEDQELRAAEKKRQEFNSEGEARHSDAYQSFKFRTGRQVSLAHTGAKINKPVHPVYFDRKPLVQLASA